MVDILVRRGAVINAESQEGCDFIIKALSRSRLVPRNELSSVDSHFYIKVKEYCKDFIDNDIHGNQLRTNMAHFASNRISKIVELASVKPLNQKVKARLSAEEIELYNIINEACESFRKKILNI